MAHFLTHHWTQTQKNEWCLLMLLSSRFVIDAMRPHFHWKFYAYTKSHSVTWKLRILYTCKMNAESARCHDIFTIVHNVKCCRVATREFQLFHILCTASENNFYVTETGKKTHQNIEWKTQPIFFSLFLVSSCWMRVHKMCQHRKEDKIILTISSPLDKRDTHTLCRYRIFIVIRPL